MASADDLPSVASRVISRTMIVPATSSRVSAARPAGGGEPGHQPDHDRAGDVFEGVGGEAAMQLKMGGDDTVDDRPDPADEQLLQSPLPLVTVSSRQEIVQGRIVALEKGPFAV